jgi:hypothetical protein
VLFPSSEEEPMNVEAASLKTISGVVPVKLPVPAIVTLDPPFKVKAVVAWPLVKLLSVAVEPDNNVQP